MSCNCPRCRVFDFLNTLGELWTRAMAWICGLDVYVGGRDGGE